MSKYIVNAAEVKDAVISLKELKEYCEQHLAKKPPESEKGKGIAHDAVKETLKEINIGWQNMIQLIEVTIQFLDEHANMVITNDTQGAKSVQSTGSGNVSI